MTEKPTRQYITALSASQDSVAKIPTYELRTQVENSLKWGASLRTQVSAFHALYELPIRSSVSPYLTNVPLEEIVLRINLVIEEFREYLSAFGLYSTVVISSPVEGAYQRPTENTVVVRQLKETQQLINEVEIADASADLKYVLEGADLTFGINSNSVSREVHASNMTKLSEEGTVIRRRDGKVLKGPNYVKPQIRKILTYSYAELEEPKDEIE